jgi:hypothetical protein
MKTPTSVYRKDSANNHVHTVPGGPDTQGALLKPSHSTQFPVHTHIYEHEGKVHETGVSPDEPGHTHELSTKGDYTGGPKPMPTKESFGPRNDSLTRVGRNWELHTAEGVFKGVGSTPEEAMRMDSDDEQYDEAFAKRAINCQDDDTWEKAKGHSLATLGTHKWAYIQHTYHMLGGK